MHKCPRCKKELYEKTRIDKGYVSIDYFICPYCDKEWDYNEVVYIGRKVRS